jgi:hypothetical protein
MLIHDADMLIYEPSMLIRDTTMLIHNKSPNKPTATAIPAQDNPIPIIPIASIESSSAFKPAASQPKPDPPSRKSNWQPRLLAALYIFARDRRENLDKGLTTVPDY